MKKYRFVDLFCGGGGSISGAISALNTAGVQYEGRGFNHWRTAIETIQANHPEIIPDIDRACAPIQSLLPDEIFNVDPERIDSIWASPSCTHHSRAAGKRPKSKQLREQPEYLLPYLRLTKCRRMYIENVKELQEWGPVLDKDIHFNGKKYYAGNADPRKKGLFFNLWYREIKASGYAVDMAVMNAADYGAATNRERLIIQAVRKSSGCKIAWPEPTHTKDPGLFSDAYKPWRSASEIIDWSVPGKSIFDRKTPLCANTMRRIEAGIKKYWGNWAEPFLVVLRGTSDSHINASAILLKDPIPTITTTGKHLVLIRPFICRNNTEHNGQAARVHDIDQPVPVIDTSNRYSVISPLVVPYKFSNGSKCADEPLQTLTTVGNHAVVSPLFIPQHSDGTVKSVSSPISTIATTGSIGIVEPFIIEYYGNSSHADIASPIHTIPTRDKFGIINGRQLITDDGRHYQLDITHRMFTTRELANATGFENDYIFCGSDTDAKKQIGNAVPPHLARALYLAELAS